MLMQAALIRALNRQVRPERRAALRPFAGRALAVRAGPLQMSLRVDDNGEFSPLHPAVPADAEMEVVGELAAALAGEKPQARVTGDPEFLRVAGETLRAAAMDLESHPVAGPAALGMRALLRAAEVWAPRAGAALVKNGATPSPTELADFSRGVASLQRRAARLATALAARRPGPSTGATNQTGGKGGGQ